jgi:hypothetical protein
MMILMSADSDPIIDCKDVKEGEIVRMKDRDVNGCWWRRHERQTAMAVAEILAKMTADTSRKLKSIMKPACTNDGYPTTASCSRMTLGKRAVIPDKKNDPSIPSFSSS